MFPFFQQKVTDGNKGPCSGIHVVPRDVEQKMLQRNTHKSKHTHKLGLWLYMGTPN